MIELAHDGAYKDVLSRMRQETHRIAHVNFIMLYMTMTAIATFVVIGWAGIMYGVDAVGQWMLSYSHTGPMVLAYVTIDIFAAIAIVAGAAISVSIINEAITRGKHFIWQTLVAQHIAKPEAIEKFQNMSLQIEKYMDNDEYRKTCEKICPITLLMYQYRKAWGEKLFVRSRKPTKYPALLFLRWFLGSGFKEVVERLSIKMYPHVSTDFWFHVRAYIDIMNDLYIKFATDFQEIKKDKAIRRHASIISNMNHSLLHKQKFAYVHFALHQSYFRPISNYPYAMKLYEKFDSRYFFNSKIIIDHYKLDPPRVYSLDPRMLDVEYIARLELLLEEVCESKFINDESKTIIRKALGHLGIFQTAFIFELGEFANLFRNFKPQENSILILSMYENGSINKLIEFEKRVVRKLKSSQAFETLVA